MPLIPASHTTWRNWLKRHPETLVLSRDTGHQRNYDVSPYRQYRRGDGLMFPVAEKNRNYDNKELTLGVTIAGVSKAYPFVELSKNRAHSFTDDINGQAVTIEWSEKDRFARALSEEGDEIPSVIGYWFAWFAFHPDTAIFRAAD